VVAATVKAKSNFGIEGELEGGLDDEVDCGEFTGGLVDSGAKI
jgi:hypothetical protein